MSVSTISGAVFRKDYTPPPYWIDHVELAFDLDPEATIVKSRIRLRRNADSSSRTLELDGEKLVLRHITVDGRQLDASQYAVESGKLVIEELPDECLLEITVETSPASNRSLYGLYQSSGIFCTQCEANGFRRITYFLDRPDVMARYRVTVRADQQRYPILLSNGNRVEARKLSDGRHEVVWEDPHPKPSYLFALVGGDLKCHRGNFVTKSGREVDLEIWVEPQNIDRCEHALISLQKAMQWDEQRYGLEYDLDVYMIVAVNDFNMGAMENKGLNIFNSKFVLASPETATDDDYLRVEAVIAHEYFHNWTGNRVTCRDWFQLTLKEGLTVFRDQQFTADQTSAAVKRIDDVALLRARQFLEDSGPMAHPIRPESYISMDNFYTATVYNKGAEIIRMYHTRLGEGGFRNGMDLYFERHDGSAVTCDDFRAAMSDAGSVDFDLVDRWYSQAGTPDLFVSERYDDQRSSYTLTMSQSYPNLAGDLPGTKDRKPVPLPVAVGLIAADGSDELLRLENEEDEAIETTRVLLLEDQSQSFTFRGIDRKPTASVLRGFSAPVKLHIERDDQTLAFLTTNDSDPFNRWDAGQQLSLRAMLCLSDHDGGRSDNLTQDSRAMQLLNLFSDSVGQVLSDDSINASYKSLLLTLPDESVLGQEMDVIDPDAAHHAHESLRLFVANQHAERLGRMYHAYQDAKGFSRSYQAISARRLKNTILDYLALLDPSDDSSLAYEQYADADNMTDKQCALSILCHQTRPQRDEALADFYGKWRHDPLVLDKWFAVQAASTRTDTVDQVRQLTTHADFTLDNPNRVRSLLGIFATNQVQFHQADGSGYELLVDHVLKIDDGNPQLAARMVSALNNYRRFDDSRQQLVRDQLSRIANHEGLSKDVSEIVDRALRF